MKKLDELCHTSTMCFARHYAVCLYKIIGTFLFGYFVTHSITEISKITIGRLRPHFIDVCRPDMSKYNCTGTYDLYVYVEDIVCTGTEIAQLFNSRLKIFPTFSINHNRWRGIWRNYRDGSPILTRTDHSHNIIVRLAHSL